MAFTDDAVRSKLAGLVDSQESIVTVSQWVLFHRRHADRVAQLWLQRLKDSTTPSKRLNYLYLANEVAQQSKIRKKDDFLNAFAPIIADATAIAYQGASHDVQQKIRRVVEVWRQRNIFDEPIIKAVESRIDELDRNRGSGKKSLGGQLFGGSSSSSIPTELKQLADLQSSLSKAELYAKPTVDTATNDYNTVNDPNFTTPPPPVHAAQLSALIKTLATAESNVTEVIKIRRDTIAELERMVAAHKPLLEKEETNRYDLETQRTSTEAKKRDVEDAIMQGLSVQDAALLTVPSSLPTNTAENGLLEEPTRPEAESFTPPPPETESFTPPLVEDEEPVYTSTTGADFLSDELPPSHEEPAPTSDLPAMLTTGTVRTRPESMSPPLHNGGYGMGGTKKRKLNDEFEAFAQDGDFMEGIDDEVAEMLEKE
ncbi:MAG: Regulation of nuclear pre-mRNA domain containing protein 1B [Bogoriella megaspora]|nr:MAG: Regulation of nuclear pre-mRNA domain containing protein 1B [Bogoriella megaspora]